MKPYDPDVHSFNITAKDGIMHIRCRQCRWNLSYTIGDEDQYRMARDAAVKHRQDSAGESEVERARR